MKSTEAEASTLVGPPGSNGFSVLFGTTDHIVRLTDSQIHLLLTGQPCRHRTSVRKVYTFCMCVKGCVRETGYSNHPRWYDWYAFCLG